LRVREQATRTKDLKKDITGGKEEMMYYDVLLIMKLSRMAMRIGRLLLVRPRRQQLSRLISSCVGTGAHSSTAAADAEAGSVQAAGDMMLRCAGAHSSTACRQLMLMRQARCQLVR
jgi:hypothetical protein